MPAGDVEQTAAGHVRDVADAGACQPVDDEILAEKNRADTGENLRSVSFHPGEQGGGLRRPGPLLADRIGSVADTLRRPLFDKRRRPGVERLDAKKRTPLMVERVQPVAMAGAADRREFAGVNPRLIDTFADDPAGILPKFVQVALDMPGVRHPAVPFRRGRSDLLALSVEDHRLDDGVAGVEAQ